jgi:molybdopterin/thiamine biosynthesis adenylyltransferase
MNPSRIILLAGLGNTGSHLAPLIARMGLADHLVLADPDLVEAGNMAAQAYNPEDIGLTKVEATANRLAGLNPHLKIECIHGELEDLPLGYFADVVVLCLDHDGARQVAAERAWWMGGVLYDVAVNGQAGLARVTRIVREIGRACLECAWSDSQYANLPVRHSCRKIAPTNSPAAHGSFAASLAALQIASPVSCDSNHEIVSSPGAGEMWITKLPENATCRFRHHSFSVECLNRFDFTVPFVDLFSLLGTTSITLPGYSFVGRGRCAGCGIDDEVLLLDRQLDRLCPRCGDVREFLPFHARTSVRSEDFSKAALSQSLDTVGLRPGDVVRTDVNRWIQLCALNSTHH